LLGDDSFDGGIIDLVVHETHSGVMVDKDGAASVPLLGETIWSTETVSPGLVAVKTL
jgi:hypothetical protein